MKQSRTTRSALFASVLALILCFSMLIGSTFAWFTDSVSSATNKIIAGNLDIELYHSNKNDTEEKVTIDTVLFDDVDPDLWEPNAIAYEKLNVKNEGKLALKYKLTLNALNATEVDGVSFASMLKVAVIEDENYSYSREGIVSDTALVWESLSTFSLEGELKKDENKLYGIVIWWQPSANDNLFNMKNESSGDVVSVDVGVQLVATQLDVESDSFNTDYDADLAYPNVSVPVKIPTTQATEDVALSANGMNVQIPAAVINALPNDVTSLSLVYTAPVADATNDTLTFESVELVDQNGKAIDLAGNQNGALTMTITAPSTFANDFVFVYHDGELVGMGTVSADGKITYTVNHFCEVVVTKELKGEVIEIDNAEDFAKLSGASLAGKTIQLLSDITFSGDVMIPAGATLNGNGKQINGSIYAGGNLTIAGHTKVTAFDASYYNNVITIGPGACLEVTGTGRVSVGWGNTFNITGTLTNAKTADKTTVQPSLIVPGISFVGSGATFNVKDAYIVSGTAQATSAKSAYSTFTFNFTNSIFDSQNNFSFINGSTDAVIFNAKDSVLNFETNLDIAHSTFKASFDNSSVTVGSSLRNEGKIELINGTTFTVKVQAQATGEHGANSGELVVDNSTLTVTAANTGGAMDGMGSGTVLLKNGASASINYYKSITVTCDNTSTFTGTEVQ